MCVRTALGGRKVQVRYSRGQAGGMDSQGKQAQEDLPACGSPKAEKPSYDQEVIDLTGDP